MIAPADKREFVFRAFVRHRPILASWGSGWPLRFEHGSQLGFPEQATLKVELVGWYMVPRLTDDVHAIVAAHQRWRSRPLTVDREEFMKP